MSLETYKGKFGTAQARRLLWRAGFGPRPGEAVALGKLGLNGAVYSLTHPGRERLVGPPPRDENKAPLAPLDAFYHDYLWWLDRMVRTSRPLAERMTLVWHDWFATTNEEVGSQKLMLRQIKLFRTRPLGSFYDLLLAVTRDPAMLIFLSGLYSTKEAPNENYGRELMELFTLGEGRGYTEKDVREQARAHTGWIADYKEDAGFYNFRWDRQYYDSGNKTIFGKRGKFDWKAACRLCVEHPMHPSFFVRKLWSYFIPTTPDAATERALIKLYLGSSYGVRPVVEAILRHPLLYQGPSMVKPPVVYLAGLLRALGRRIDTTEYAIHGYTAGQALFYPPSVAGWDDDRWLDTATFRGRWALATAVLRKSILDPEKKAGSLPADPVKLLALAHKTTGYPAIRKQTRDVLLEFAQNALADAEDDYEHAVHPVLIFNAMCQLIIVSPEQQTS